jgi:hypothetical protein
VLDRPAVLAGVLELLAVAILLRRKLAGESLPRVDPEARLYRVRLFIRDQDRLERHPIALAISRARVFPAELFVRLEPSVDGSLVGPSLALFAETMEGAACGDGLADFVGDLARVGGRASGSCHLNCAIPGD